MKALRTISLAVALGASLAATSVSAAAIHDSVLFTTILPANDDGSTGQVSLGFTANIGGTNFTQTYVNNNGNVTFNNPLGTFTPAAISSGSFGPIIAPFFADVDTRALLSLPVTYGAATLGGQLVFGVNYIHVGVFSALPFFNDFQMILTDRVDTGAGNFDIQFNYDHIVWEAGQASGSSATGLGGTSALVGYWLSNASQATLPGSLLNGALIDGGPDALISHSLNSTVLGQYNFQVRGGAVVNPPSRVPEPGSMALLGLGLAGLVFTSRKKRPA